MKTIKSILILLLAAIPSFIHAQSSIEYTYDAAGNRILREPVRSRLQGEDSDSLSMDNRMKLLNITVTPNPTKGPVTVYITGIEDEDACKLSLFDPMGRQLQTLFMKGNTAVLDLSSLPAGCYFLAVTYNEEKSSYRIIKE